MKTTDLNMPIIGGNCGNVTGTAMFSNAKEIHFSFHNFMISTSVTQSFLPLCVGC